MQHAEAREAMDRAAVEPGGIERVEAGDTMDSAALAEHLLYCRECALEWQRVRRTATVLRAVVGPAAKTTGANPAAPATDDRRSATAVEERAPAELRERTLAFVRDVGRPRDATATPTLTDASPAARPHEAAGPVVAAAADAVRSARSPEPIRLRSRRWPQLLALAAAIVVAVGLGGVAYIRNQQLDESRQVAATLAEIAEASTHLAASPDARTVTLSPTAPGNGSGALLFSARTGEIVMVSRDIPATAQGKVLSCWVETGGKHVKLGQLSVESGIGYWWGWVDGGLPNVKPGDQFGVSVVSAGGALGQPILTGVLGS